MRQDILDLIKESNAIESVHDPQELHQSLKAWKYLITVESLGKKEISEVHRLIMERLDPHIAGKFRRVNVRVGHDVKMPWTKVIRSLEALLEHQPYNALSSLEWHLQFEDIHPFEDGNGRTGRMIYWWHCVSLGLEPLMFRAEDKSGYYSLFWKKTCQPASMK